MPSKPLIQQRAWGTRYDSLTTSPNSTGSSEESPPNRALDVARESPPQFRMRDWADDDGPAMLLLSQLNSGGTTVASPITPRRESTRMPHNASVFVGRSAKSYLVHNVPTLTFVCSLPTDMNELEMTQILRDHLAKLAHVQHIKIIHDSKGSMCGFIQCEVSIGRFLSTRTVLIFAKTAEEAAQIIAQSPQPFAGRYLRYESARAFRSLWISYRSPTKFVPGGPDDQGISIRIYAHIAWSLRHVLWLRCGTSRSR